MKIGIYGYGNLGKGVESAICRNPDMQIFGVFTRRDSASLFTASGAKVYPASDVIKYKDEIDVLIICGGSANDLPEMTPELTENFNIVDSFDNHKKIEGHFERTDKAAVKGGKIAVISGGWDPGLFSLARAYADAVLPESSSYTFWGRGVSQGHSNAVKAVPGVADACQYTVPSETALAMVRQGLCPELTTGQKHTRECYVAAEPDADKNAIEEAIKNMPDYFADYDTTVTFVTEEELRKNHSGLPHGGTVISTGHTGMNGEYVQTIEYSLKLDSNPCFTGSILTALARAAFRMNSRGESGCKTVFDICPSDMSSKTAKELRTLL